LKQGRRITISEKDSTRGAENPGQSTQPETTEKVVLRPLTLMVDMLPWSRKKEKKPITMSEVKIPGKG
jgi:hypothetical protein